MMRKTVIVLLLIFIPSICLAVRYQVSCDMTFCDSADFVTVWSYLDGMRDLGQYPAIDPDYLWPVSIDPNNPAGCRVWGRLRVESAEDGDTIYDYLDAVRADVDPNTSGFLEKHDCRMNEGPCPAPNIIEWGMDL